MIGVPSRQFGSTWMAEKLSFLPSLWGSRRRVMWSACRRAFGEAWGTGFPSFFDLDDGKLLELMPKGISGGSFGEQNNIEQHCRRWRMVM